jgi:hypothetical protein
VVSTLKACGRQHALVVEEEERRPVVAGDIFCIADCSPDGYSLQTTEVARTFAEIEAAIAG